MRAWGDREGAEAGGASMSAQAEADAVTQSDTQSAPPADTPHDDALLSLPLASPWRRWCARLFDLWWECMLIGMVLGMVAGLFAPGLLDMIDSPGGDKLLGLAMLPPALLLDAALMAYFGNTPGKALLGLRVGLVDGRPLSFVQLCWRNLGVWAAGLGLGLPLVNLFTMARQHRRLVSGQAASYDEEGFRVRARPIGWWRCLGFGLAFVTLIVLLVSLNVADTATQADAARSDGPSFQWTNPGTGRTIGVAPQWRYHSAVSDDGMLLHQFTEHGGNAVVIITAEDAEGMSLAQYARAWTPGLGDAFVVANGALGEFRGQPSWTAEGSGKRDDVRVRIRLVLADGKVWRLNVVQSPPLVQTDALAGDLAERLWDSVLSPP